MRPGANLEESIIDVKHAELQRIGDSTFKSQCPKCKPGILAMHRDPVTKALMNTDSCLFCGQTFRYTDVKKGRLPRPKRTTHAPAR